MVVLLRGALPALRHTPLLMVAPSTGKPATQLQCTVALVKNIVGTGVLSLPAGISRLSDGGASSTEALTLASVLMLAFGALNGFGFWLIGDACAATSQKSYVGAWRASLGESTSFLPALMSLFLCFTGTVACATVIGELGTDLVAGVMHTSYDSVSKTSVLAAISVGILTPLCLLPSLAPLGSASLIGVLGILLTGGSMAVRLVDGSYGPAGQFAAEAIATPTFHEATTQLGAVSPPAGATFFYLSLVSNAFLAHYNAPGVFNECRAAAAASSQPVQAPAQAPTDAGVSGASGVAKAGGTEAAGPVGTAVNTGDSGEADGKFDPCEADLLGRLTSTLAAEEVNRQFEMYIESVPSFGVRSAFEKGYEEGYLAGYGAGLQAGEALQNDRRPSPKASDAPAPMSASAAERRRPESAVPATSNEDRRLGLAPFRRVVTGAFGISCALFLLVAWCGFATFGDASDALILNNYASDDPLAAAARFGILLAVLFEYPLLERPFRLTALELLLPIPQFTGAITRIANTPVAAIASVALITAIAAAGVPLDSLGALGGCTGGALLIYVAPALMTLKLRAQPPEGADLAELGVVTTVGLWGVAVTGLVLAVVGTVDAVSQMV